MSAGRISPGGAAWLLAITNRLEKAALADLFDSRPPALGVIPEPPTNSPGFGDFADEVARFVPVENVDRGNPGG
jgi:hypothetical protein